MANIFETGFLGTKASFMMDFVSVSMFILIPLLFWSVNAIRKGNQSLHMRLQVILSIIFLVAFILFEIDVNYLNPNWKDDAANLSWITPILLVHIPCAILTVVVWPVALYKGLYYNGEHTLETKRSHRAWGRWAFGLMLGTAGTGVLFYLVAFPW